MTLELVDESDVKPSTKETPKKIENVKLKIISKEDVVYCERAKRGMTGNCTICETLNKEFFSRCNNKWSYDGL